MKLATRCDIHHASMVDAAFWLEFLLFHSFAVIKPLGGVAGRAAALAAAGAAHCLQVVLHIPCGERQESARPGNKQLAPGAESSFP